ncbi:G-type lectin S-receptor serine/threonine-protein kinase [Salix suchowensis]|nr:G-type lectin S-receptor serine/threonine-protein kinase [Salix suchowensis]
MALGNCKVAAALLLLLSCSCSFYGDAGDSITASQPIRDPEAIVSAGNKFKLGFFSPLNSTYRYVGIWYSTISAETQVVWVANRDMPINDSSGMMTISDEGKLVVLNGQGEALWSSTVSLGSNHSTAQLDDDGSLVLKSGPNGNQVWTSFQEPTDTYLTKMRLSANARTGNKTLLTSWRSSSDPSVGNFSAGINPLGIPELFMWYNDDPLWRSGPWVGQKFIGIPGMSTNVYLRGFSLQPEGDGTITLSSTVDPVLRFAYVLTSRGKLTEQYWDSEKGGWRFDWEAPSAECDIYGKCGPFGSCDAQNSPICRCLKGFVPKNQDEWNKGIWTSGCVRMASLQCDRIQNGTEVGKEDGFMKLEMMKVPTFAEYWSYMSSEQDCKDECLKNCSCVAYSYYNGFGCMAWTGNLIDIQKFSEGGADLNIRLAYTELDKKRNLKVMISMSVIGGATAIFICVFFSWKWMATHRATVSDGNLPENAKEVKLEPLFKLQALETATNNFHISNKLGQGGFGGVYRGTLPDGKEIAVKRLSRTSGQGLQELKNEVVVISKLQHRNLVRLLGCCVEGEEMMLVYEYMPNKSLDAFLFG